MRYPFRMLQGAQVLYVSTRGSTPKAHLIADCEGFAATPPEARRELRYSRVEHLAMDRSTRPCRMCALSSVLLSVTRRCKEPATHLVTFTSQHAPTAVDANPMRYGYGKFTESGSLRLRRVCGKLGFPVVTTVAGPAGVAAMPAAVAEVFAANLRTAVVGPWEGLLPLTAAEVFWALAVDAPPEVGTGQEAVEELWQLAGRLAA